MPSNTASSMAGVPPAFQIWPFSRTSFKQHFDIIGNKTRDEAEDDGLPPCLGGAIVASLAVYLNPWAYQLLFWVFADDADLGVAIEAIESRQQDIAQCWDNKTIEGSMSFQCLDFCRLQ